MAMRRSSETMAISSAIGDMQVAEESFKDVNFQSAPPASFPESAPASFRQRKADCQASKETIQEGFIGLGGTNNGGIVVQESNLPSGGFSRPPQDEYKRYYYGKLPVTGRNQVGKREGQSPRKIRQDPCWDTQQAEAGGSASRDAFMSAPPPMEHVALHGLFLPLMGPGGKRSLLSWFTQCRARDRDANQWYEEERNDEKWYPRSCSARFQNCMTEQPPPGTGPSTGPKLHDRATTTRYRSQSTGTGTGAGTGTGGAGAGHRSLSGICPRVRSTLGFVCWALAEFLWRGARVLC